jgi:glycosyltransferase involved in cell wall biosynthesis
VVLYDNKNGNPEVLDFLLPFNIKPNVQTWRCFDWNDNFADFKNKLNSYCTGDYIYQIDADEMISEYIVKNLHQILEMNPNVDLIFVPRINTVDGITQEHIDMWRWNVNDKGHINFPDMQGRIYKKNLDWYGKVHERIIGGSKFATLPYDEEYCIQHHKTIQRQEKQNKYYGTI